MGSPASGPRPARAGPARCWANPRGSYIAHGRAFCHPRLVCDVALIVPGAMAGGGPGPVSDHRSLVADPALLAGLEPDLRARAERLAVQSPETVARIRETKLPAAAIHDVELEARLHRDFAFSFHDEMMNVACDRPSLIVCGRQDAIVGHAEAQVIQNRFPRGTFALLDCAGHAPGWERPGLFAALVLDWLKRIERT